MAEDQLAAAQETVRDRLLRQQTTLRSALASLDRLPMDREKWSLDQTVTKAKWEAGSLSDEDWQSFLEDQRAFAADADQRGVTLLVAHLAYRDGLGLELDVEEWLK
jgi:ABC-type enterobactin transport system permease subunit